MGGQSAAPSLRSKYMLQSVIVHHGSADSGHYTAFRRVSHVDRETILGRMDGGGLLSEDINAWVHVSDDAVAPASVDEVLESEAYMLFYQALDSLGGAEDAADDDSQG
jgi:ubiquitin C-terminal hydrolase